LLTNTTELAEFAVTSSTTKRRKRKAPSEEPETVQQIEDLVEADSSPISRKTKGKVPAKTSLLAKTVSSETTAPASQPPKKKRARSSNGTFVKKVQAPVLQEDSNGEGIVVAPRRSDPVEVPGDSEEEDEEKGEEVIEGGGDDDVTMGEDVITSTEMDVPPQLGENPPVAAVTEALTQLAKKGEEPAAVEAEVMVQDEQAAAEQSGVGSETPGKDVTEPRDDLGGEWMNIDDVVSDTSVAKNAGEVVKPGEATAGAEAGEEVVNAEDGLDAVEVVKPIEAVAGDETEPANEGTSATPATTEAAAPTKDSDDCTKHAVLVTTENIAVSSDATTIMSASVPTVEEPPAVTIELQPAAPTTGGLSMAVDETVEA
jgi:hypothetical protein